jgi:hypothetical protein
VDLERCRTCGAGVRPGAPWCTQCYGDPRAVPAPPVVEAAAPQPRPGPAPAPEPVDGPPTWPCAACDEHNDLDAVACAACGLPFLGALQAARPTLHVPGFGDLGALPRATRLGLAAAAVSVVLVLTALLGLLLP